MIEQAEIDFTGRAYARKTDPQTSKAAADSVRGEEATRMEKLVFEAIAGARDGLTSHEVSKSTGIPFWSATPRIRPLVRKGFVYDSGERRVGDSGRKSIVWKAGKNPLT